MQLPWHTGDAVPMRCQCCRWLQQKVASARLEKYFSLLESFLALLPQKRNFRFLFLNQGKLKNTTKIFSKTRPENPKKSQKK
jgi:hypothetical protein